MHQVFILSYELPLVYLLLPFYFLVILFHMSQVFRVYVLVHGLDSFLSYPAYECVPCFVLSNWMDVNMNTIILRHHPKGGFA